MAIAVSRKARAARPYQRRCRIFPQSALKLLNVTPLDRTGLVAAEPSNRDANFVILVRDRKAGRSVSRGAPRLHITGYANLLSDHRGLPRFFAPCRVGAAP
jgi:hypothetical protein